MRYLKNSLSYASLSILALLVLSTLFFVGCEKEQVMNQYNSLDSDSVNTSISDENFYTSISEKIGTEPMAKWFFNRTKADIENDYQQVLNKIDISIEVDEDLKRFPHLLK